MRGRSAQISLTFVTLVLGVLLVMQLRTQGRLAKSLAAQSTTDQSTIISNLYDANTALRTEVLKLRTELDRYDSSIGQSELDAMEKELETLSIVNGLSEVSGPGVELLTFADLRAEDLQDLINEMRNAGAEALALNGIRITVRSSVTQEAGKVKLDGRTISLPFALVSIGQPETLERALQRKGGLVTYLQNTYSGATVSVEKKNRIILPTAASTNQWNYAAPSR